ncbi:hypothetical protein TNCV_4414891 [Trichonephila clavipes]|uniref:Uncharacterized protein n=1 Tax=Trichonephila clavipes TaxID=2585209 RepID=A0A8X6S9H2_TRICX|nr:hypothetical protein TNCV_4414891 [Trichonephila clavipes]
MSSFLVLSEGDTRNRWRDGQVCPDVGQGTMAPWARRLGREGRTEKDGREEREEEKRTEREKGKRRERERRERRKEKGEETEGEERGDGKGEEKESGRERGARLVWRKGLSPEIGVERR